MNQVLRCALIAPVLWFNLSVVPSSAAALGAPTDQTDQTVRHADKTLLDAFAKNDRRTLDTLFDAQFTWIDSLGKSLTRAQVLQSLPSPANADVSPQLRAYGQSAVVRANRGRMQVLRIWVLRPSGWHALLYQEVQLAVKSEPPVRIGSGSSSCENPCRTIPITPETQNEREAIASWQGVMRAMADEDADAYAPLIADEFTATDTHHDATYTKANRLAQIRRQKQKGVKSTPSPLISARMFDFGDTVMMIAREQRPNAKPYFNTRMWIKRGARWQMLFSFNTRIE
jgi:Domain of unknown function (DUF4440)